jgi:hypothetical protein
MYRMFGPQLVVLFLEILETLGDEALLEEADHCRHAFDGYTGPQSSCPLVDEEGPPPHAPSP